MITMPLPNMARNAKRFETIIRTLARYGLADWVRDWNPDFVKDYFKGVDGRPIAERSHEERLRLALTDLGTTFIKLGQILSTRSDVIGPELAEELSKLQSSTPADSPELVVTTIESELGRPPERLYREFDSHAAGSASIAQVHLATLPSGEPVVVKVQHAGIEEIVQQDLEILAFLARIAEKHSTELRLYQPRGLVAEFRRNLLRELDFLREKRSLDEFARNFRDDPTVHFPKPYPELTSRRVLTMERLEGIPIAQTEMLDNHGIDTEQIAWNGATAFLEMVFRDGFYHADPHPGNIWVLQDNVVGLLDCGMVGRLDDTRKAELENLVQAGVDRDTEAMTDLVVQMGSLPPDLDREQLRADIADFVSDYAGESIRDLNLSEALNEIVAIIRRHRILLPPSISLLIRMLVVLEGSARLLSRDFSLIELLNPYVQKRLVHQLSPEHLLQQLRRSYRDWTRLLNALPRELTDILGRVRKGTFDVNLEHRRLDTVVNRVVYGILTASLFLGSTMMWSRQAPPTIYGVSLFGAAGAVAAVVLAWRLLRAIKKEGGLQK
jgi:ubiquinone biosynthesis protein